MAAATPWEALLERPAALKVVIGIVSGTSGSRLPLAGMRIELALPTAGEVLIPECQRTVTMTGVQADTVRENAAPG